MFCAEIRLVGSQPAAADLQPLLLVHGRLSCLNRLGELRITILQCFLPLQVPQLPHLHSSTIFGLIFCLCGLLVI